MFRELTVVAVAAALLWAAPAQAADVTEGEANTCKLVGLTAKAIMTARQDGVAPTVVYEKLATVFDAKMPSMVKLVIIMIREAYKGPGYFTDEMKEKVINEFQAKQEAECFEYVSGQ
jgi:hypothetical protein